MGNPSWLPRAKAFATAQKRPARCPRDRFTPSARSKRGATPPRALHPAPAAVVLVLRRPGNTRPRHALTPRIHASAPAALVAIRARAAIARAPAALTGLPAGTRVPAAAAVRIPVQRGLAAIRNATRAVIVPRRARSDLAAPRAATTRSMRRVTRPAATPAMVVRVQRLLAAIVAPPIAIPPTGLAHQARALPGATLGPRHPRQRGTVIPAAPAVLHAPQVRLAAVVPLPIAVRIRCIAARDRTLPRVTAPLRLRIGSALHAAGPAVPRGRQVGLAAVAGIAIAIRHVRRALRRATPPTRTLVRRRTRTVARPAVLGIVAQADATRAAVRERRLARHELALPGLAARLAARQRAGHPAATAVARRAQRSLAAIGIDAVAVAPAVLAADGGGALPAVAELVVVTSVIDQARAPAHVGRAHAALHVLQRAARAARAAVRATGERLLAAALRIAVAVEVAFLAVDDRALTGDAHALRARSDTDAVVLGAFAAAQDRCIGHARGTRVDVVLAAVLVRAARLVFGQPCVVRAARDEEATREPCVGVRGYSSQAFGMLWEQPCA